MIRKLRDELLHFFSDETDPDEPVYDPVHLAAMIVIVIFSIGVLFWLLWTLLVYEGGLFVKIVPALEAVFTKKTMQDFGWVGYPYEMGVFAGFAANCTALILTMSLIAAIWHLFNKTKHLEKGDKNGSADQ